MVTENGNGKAQSSEFTWQQSKSERLLIYWRGREIMVIKGEQSIKLADKLAHADSKQQQMLLAKITGNFKRGNEIN